MTSQELQETSMNYADHANYQKRRRKSFWGYGVQTTRISRSSSRTSENMTILAPTHLPEGSTP
jgi:hypothetical protein